MKGRQPFWIACALLLSSVSAIAHHAFAAEFDADKPVSLRGTLVKMEWVNPHGWIHLAIKDPQGAIVNWMCETGAPNALLRRGWTRDTMKVGMELVVDGYQAKDGTKKMTAEKVLLPDGSKLFAAGSANPSAGEAPK